MKMRIFNTGFPRINLAFLLVVITVVGNVVFNYYLLSRNKKSIASMTGVINPYVEALDELKLMVTESKMYATNWVYLQNSVDDKESLDRLHRERFSALKKRLLSLSQRRSNREDAVGLAKVFSNFNQLIDVEKKIMSTLVTFDDYENPGKKFECEELIESEVLPRTKDIMAMLSSLIDRNRREAIAMTAAIERNSARMMTIMLVTSFGLLVVILAAIYFISNGIRRPVQEMKQVITRLSRGQLMKGQLRASADVVGETVSSVNVLSESFAKTSEFANEIGKGNLDVQYEKLSNEDVLGNALINMRNSLKAYSENMEQQVRVRTEEVFEKGRKLEIAYREIKDSINYARRIQESILPADEMIKSTFADSFVFYRPKDVVCGDFYWFGKKGKDVVIAAVDCTGHGVPGALMTVIGNSLLNQIINFSGVTRPAEVLHQLDKKLHETLKQHGGSNVTSDGMDMAICHYEVGGEKITFAGAKRPLFLMRKNKLREIKGSKAPIGSYLEDYNKQFEEHEITVKKDDTVYLFSDGLPDQFGGLEGKKYMISRFRDLLHSIQGFTMTEQKRQVDKEISSWQRDYEQTDDMLLIGIRF